MGNLGPTEIILILLVLVLLFGAKKLPELARGSGRALRIFKAETKGLMDEDDSTKTDEQRAIEAQNAADNARFTQSTTHVTPQPVSQPRSDSDR
jgi:sec-independent protein translocase protein TatA